MSRSHSFVFSWQGPGFDLSLLHVLSMWDFSYSSHTPKICLIKSIRESQLSLSECGTPVQGVFPAFMCTGIGSSRQTLVDVQALHKYIIIHNT